MENKSLISRIYSFIDKCLSFIRIKWGYNTRPFTAFCKDYFDDKDFKNLIGVEIGTLQGYNALNICKQLPIKQLYCIDSLEGKFSVFFKLAKALSLNSILSLNLQSCL